jgi:hypothetical protein
VFDDSSSIGPDNFAKVTDFGVQIANSYTWDSAAQQGITMSLVVFSDTAMAVFNWTSNQQAAVRQMRLLVARDGLKTCIGCGIDKAAYQFSIRPFTRNSVSKCMLSTEHTHHHFVQRFRDSNLFFFVSSGLFLDRWCRQRSDA